MTTLETLRAALDALERVSLVDDILSPSLCGAVNNSAADLRTLIAAMEKQKPVAWIAVNKSYKERRAELTFYPKSSWLDNHEITPLYTHPAQPVEQPALTDEQIDAITNEQWRHHAWEGTTPLMRRVARAIEQAIKGAA